MYRKGIDNLDFQYVNGFDVDYNYHYACQHGSDCCDDDFCRCGEIIDIEYKIGSVSDAVSHIESVLDYTDLTEIDHYGVDRLAAIHKIWDKESYEVAVCGGYYGEEVDGIFLQNGHTMVSEMNEFLGLRTNRDKIEYLLKAEYGFVHDRLKDKNWRVKFVNREQINFGQNEYYHHVNQDLIKDYVDYDLPRGICLENDNSYSVMDGYHRLTACNDEQVRVIVGK